MPPCLRTTEASLSAADGYQQALFGGSAHLNPAARARMARNAKAHGAERLAQQILQAREGSGGALGEALLQRFGPGKA